MGEPLRLLPDGSWTYPVLLLVAMSILIFIVVFHVSQWHIGAVRGQSAGRVDIVAGRRRDRVCPSSQTPGEERGDVLFCLQSTAAQLRTRQAGRGVRRRFSQATYAISRIRLQVSDSLRFGLNPARSRASRAADKSPI